MNQQPSPTGQSAYESLSGTFEAWSSEPLTWSPESESRPKIVCFRDDKTYDLGADLDASRFRRIADRMRSGAYYPEDAVQFWSPKLTRHESFEPGDRSLQIARLIPFLHFPTVVTMVEIFVSERTDSSCSIGYVTTRKHFAEGIWRADLTLSESRLSLRVQSVAQPNSLLYWLGLPYARFLQLRARSRAVETFMLE